MGKDTQVDDHIYEAFKEETKFSADKVSELWLQIQDVLKGTSGAHNHALVDQIDPETIGLSKSSVSAVLLPQMRNILEEHGKIKVREEKGEGRSDRKIWVVE